MVAKEPKVTASIDLDRKGKQFGHLTVPHSRDDSAWGAVHVPIVSIRNGNGPTVVFTGGSHGDEYEGPIALMKLARALQPGEIKGQVVILPTLNHPAVMAGTRTSPIDGVNMNRAFPGRRDGSVTQMIAHYLQHRILPRCDALADIHSGGKTLMFSPFAAYHRLPDEALTAKARAAVEAFGAPIGLELVELDAEGMLDSAVEDMGKVFVSTELGGGGTATVDTVGLAETGLRNLLAHFGITDGWPTTPEERGQMPTRMMHMPAPDCVAIAGDYGLWEPLADLGWTVSAGDALGQMHFPERPEREPVLYSAAAAGTLIGRTHKQLIEPGDFLALIAQDL